PAGLDKASIQMIGASHPYTWRLYGPGILEVRFDMIHLPDSNTNEASSHGFAAFSIKPSQSLTDGDIVSNRAAIYFDYNDPIITPPALLHISSTSSASNLNINKVFDFTMSPNPVARLSPVLLTFPEEISGKIEVLVMDINGRIVQQTRLDSQQIMLPGMQSGAYIVQMKSEKSSKSKLLIIE
ncbi:MAG: T9SS type A sorting domain-containing protein, partial [Saprospiraceae bacterium]|nr:T9SS type A sorting domain-containing protein [Saprospiraceae bacterium]